MPILLLTGAPLIASTQAMMVGLYMALIPMFLGYLLFGYGLMQVAPSAATTLTLAESVVASLLSVVIVGERLPVFGWVGLAGICASLLILSLAPATQERTSEP
ncbi:EamA family transporter [Corynebacteriaceae bacterium 6-324]